MREYGVIIETLSNLEHPLVGERRQQVIDRLWFNFRRTGKKLGFPVDAEPEILDGLPYRDMRLVRDDGDEVDFDALHEEYGRYLTLPMEGHHLEWTGCYRIPMAWRYDLQ